MQTVKSKVKHYGANEERQRSCSPVRPSMKITTWAVSSACGVGGGRIWWTTWRKVPIKRRFRLTSNRVSLRGKRPITPCKPNLYWFHVKFGVLKGKEGKWAVLKKYVGGGGFKMMVSVTRNTPNHLEGKFNHDRQSSVIIIWASEVESGRGEYVVQYIVWEACSFSIFFILKTL